MSYRMFGFYAHPDDEILGPGGTVALYARQDVHIEWVCTTRGEAGEIAPTTDATRETLPAVREQEMHCSAKLLGIQQVHFLGYRDSGMAGTAENDHADAYINSKDSEVVPRLVELIRRVRPHVILTFEPYGGYGHPDHIKIHHHTHLAITAAADPAYHPELGAAWNTPRLFYPFIPLATFQAMRERMAAQGMDVSFFDSMEERIEKGWPDDQVHAVINIEETISQKLNAFHCHATQFGPDNLFRQLSEPAMAEIFSHEHFALARPEPEPGLMLSTLFEGLENAES